MVEEHGFRSQLARRLTECIRSQRGFGANSQWYAFQTGVNILQPAPGTFTNQRSRNIFYQPGFQNWKLGLFNNFYTTKTQYLTLRFEVFNWLNHPNWGGATGGGLDVNDRCELRKGDIQGQPASAAVKSAIHVLRVV
jgi:hypothetical protein